MFIGIHPPYAINPEHHITLAFLGKATRKQRYMAAVVATAHAVQEWNRNGRGTIPIEFGDIKTFNNRPPVYYAEVHSPKLHKFQHLLVQQLEKFEVHYLDDFDFVPHLTLSYREEPDHNPYEGRRFTVPSVSVESSAFGRTIIRL